MQSISRRLQKINYSQTLAMSAKTRALKAKGLDVISLNIGEPDFSPPSYILEAAKKAVDQGHHYYTPVSGSLELREAVCEKFLRDNLLHYNPSQIVVSAGSKQSISNLFLSLLNPGDKVIIPSPFWVSYYEMVNLCEALPVIIHTSISTDFKITPEQLEEAITPDVKIFIFSSPCNPTGSVYSSEELKCLTKVFVKHPDVIIISDEIYEYINYSEKYTSIGSFPDVYEQTVTLNGISKTFAMTGWRIGFIGAPLWIAKTCEKVQGQTSSGTNSIAQQAAIIALKSHPNRIAYMIEAFRKRRDLVLDMMKEIPGFKSNEPVGSFYIFPNIAEIFGNTFLGVKISNAYDLSMFLLEKAQVATVAGSSFGAESNLRISYASSEETLKEAFKRIKRMLL
ncbi:aspartate aminotransferase [Candidatus Uzinura diaspidicola str. ASNER]|uniref:Aminotransferase n=1 Tax=Candidatus Uzinura diaspidicola str. ASNER TaxID=1133592 RepID=L7VK29_9FLAO|nr:aspartate aminotransferase [Candidatus Uzinura diaspidicola str. ASNER]